jgi:hypothetical protein
VKGRPAFGAAGVALLAGLAAYALAEPALAAQSLLIAATTALAVPSGALALLAIGQLTGGAWQAALAPALRALAATLPLALVLFVPLLAALELLYPWTAPPDTLSETVRRKLSYLNEAGFLARAVLTFAALGAMAGLLGVYRRAPRERRPARAVAALVLWLPAISVWGVDWLMSLEPEWYSSAFGLVLAAQHLLAALAAAIALAPRLAPLAPAQRHDLGNLLLGAVLLWAYLAFMQLLIVWEANLPHQAGWYAPRLHGPWLALGAANAALHFALPFAALLSRPLKRAPGPLLTVAALVLAGHVADGVWLAAPAFDRPAWAGAGDLLALAVAGVLLTFAATRRSGAPDRVLGRQHA